MRRHQGPAENETKACLAALFLTDPKVDRLQLERQKGSRVEGTCEWILSNEIYREWLDKRCGLLWLCGGPGKGKTMLSLFLVQQIERNVSTTNDSLFIYYFCDNRADNRNTGEAVLRGLISQLLQLRSSLIEHILPSFRVQRDELFTKIDALWEVFEAMIRDPSLDTIYCVLDGVDECETDSAEFLLEKFTLALPCNLTTPPICGLKVVITSREFPDFIGERLHGFPRIRLEPDANAEIDADIHRFIEDKVADLSIRKKYPDSLRDHVKGHLSTAQMGHSYGWVLSPESLTSVRQLRSYAPWKISRQA